MNMGKRLTDKSGIFRLTPIYFSPNALYCIGRQKRLLIRNMMGNGGMMEEISNIDLICNRYTAGFWGTGFFWLPVAWTAGHRLFSENTMAGGEWILPFVLPLACTSLISIAINLGAIWLRSSRPEEAVFRRHPRFYACGIWAGNLTLLLPVLLFWLLRVFDTVRKVW